MVSGFAHESSAMESVEWYTPPEIFEGLGLQFDLDPCSPGAGKSFVPALRHYTVEDDGLASPWAGTVFMNPPYGKYTATWMEKFTAHGDGIALVFSRTDVKWFQEHAEQFDVVCFVAGRIRFYQGGIDKQGGTPGAGSMLIAIGDKSRRALLGSGLGLCFSPVQQAQAALQPTSRRKRKLL